MESIAENRVVNDKKIVGFLQKNTCFFFAVVLI